MATSCFPRGRKFEGNLPQWKHKISGNRQLGDLGSLDSQNRELQQVSGGRIRGFLGVPAFVGLVFEFPFHLKDHTVDPFAPRNETMVESIVC